MKTDMSPIYAAALILNPARRTRYIETHWPKKWVKPVLVRVKRLWERYRDEGPKAPIIPTTSPSTTSSSQEPEVLDTYDRLALALQSVTRPASGDKYIDFNIEELYNPSKKGALV